MFSKKLNVQETDELASPRMRQKFLFIEGASANAVRSDPSYKTTNKRMTVLLKIAEASIWLPMGAAVQELK